MEKPDVAALEARMKAMQAEREKLLATVFVKALCLPNRPFQLRFSQVAQARKEAAAAQVKRCFSVTFGNSTLTLNWPGGQGARGQRPAKNRGEKRSCTG